MRIALGVSYAGTPYQGWQSQACGNTVQDKLEAALSQFATQPVSTLCAGRTDSGVHGLMQVVHFDTELVRDIHAWVRGVNTYLPTDIAIQWARAVPDAFHARASATARRYVYCLLESPVRPSIDANRVGWVFAPLNEAAMVDAARHLVGTHDFSSFRAAACQALSPVKTLLRVDIVKRGHYWRFEFEGNAFLHHMIRNIMGALLAIGKGAQEPAWIRDLLLAKNRKLAAPTFAPDGLYFAGPVYAEHWGLPSQSPAMDWLPG